MLSSADEFIRLRYSEEPEEYNRAAHESAPFAVWVEVIERHPEARFWVAQNKTVPLEILAILASDPDPNVRLMVAMKRKLIPELLEQLSRDDDESVRMRVAMHKNTSRATLEKLTEDPWPPIRAVVAERLAEPKGI